MTISERAAAAALALGLCAGATPGAGPGESAGAAAPGGTRWRPAASGHAWSFPRDHWAHRAYRTEWWYLTGHLECAGAASRRYGYQLTFFRIGLLSDPVGLDSDWAADTLVMGHAAVTDLARGEHRFSDLLRREMPLLAGFGRHPDPLIAWARAPAGTDGTWTLRFNGEAFDVEMLDEAGGIAFTLRTRPLKPLVLQGPEGLSRKGRDPGAASLYYSLTRLATEGRVRFGDAACDARGVSWMDKEIGSHQLGERQVGWDWFGLQLADGRDLMLYSLRRRDGTIDHRSGTLVSPEGAPRYLSDTEWSARAAGTWRSPRTGAEYPSGWVIEIPGERLRLEVTPRARDQENRSRVAGAPYYWEGAVSVRGPGGAQAGQGYVELTGYGENNRPPV